MSVNDRDDAQQLYGRMMECWDIEHAIESGQAKSMDDILAYVKARSDYLRSELKDSEYFSGCRSVSNDEYESTVAQYQANLVEHKH